MKCVCFALMLLLLSACAPVTDAVAPAPQSNEPATSLIETPKAPAHEATPTPNVDEAEPESEKIDTRNRVTISASSPNFSFEEACNRAVHVVYGEVLSKGESSVMEYEGESRTDCFRDVTIEVIKSAKGGLAPGDTLTYREWGGETDEKIYIYYGTEIVEVGDHVLIFQSPKLGPLTDAYFWIVDESTKEVRIEANRVENVFAAQVEALSEEEKYLSVTVDEILQAVRDYVATDAEIMNDTTVE